MQTELSILNKTFVQRKGNVVSDMNGSKVMLSIEQGKYYNLGNIGGDIWDLLETPIKIKDIVSKLYGIYEVDEETCKKEVQFFMNQLLKEALVVECSK